jgi:hypothetical protein
MWSLEIKINQREPNSLNIESNLQKMTSALQDDQIKAIQTIPSFGRRTGTKYSTPESEKVLPSSSAIKNFSYTS